VLFVSVFFPRVLMPATVTAAEVLREEAMSGGRQSGTAAPLAG